MINIIEVGLGNVRSVYNWVHSRTERISFIKRPRDYQSGPIIIPGVASSSQLMLKLEENKLDGLIKSVAKKETVLGICAGYQVLCQLTTEQQTVKCLGLLPGEVHQLNQEKSRTGWNEVDIPLHEDSPLSRAYPRNKRLTGQAFFNHAFGVFLGDSHHDFMLSRNIVGCQFHPEKSREFGQLLLQGLILE